MGLFAVGFAAVASLLPAGILLEKQIMANTDAAITGRNSLEVMKGKGMNPLTYELLGRMICGTAVGPSGTGASQPINFKATRYLAPIASDDMEQRMFDSRPSPAGEPPGFTIMYQFCAPVQSFCDTNGNNQAWNPNVGRIWQNPLDQGAGGDRTDWPTGRIHALKNRPQPFYTLGFYSPLDFSYPSSVLDISARTYLTHVLWSNESLTPLAGDDWNYDPAANNYLLTGITVRSGQGLEWPEQAEGDPASAQVFTPPGSVAACAGPPSWLMSNAPHQMRSATGGKTTGNSESFGYCNNFYDCFVNTPPWRAWIPGWNWAPYLGFYAATVPDTGGKYSLPAPVGVLAISFDKSKDLVLLRYPQAYARTPTASNTTRLGNYRTANNITAANWVDRRLKKGDAFMSGSHGYVFRVVNVLDENSALGSLPAGLKAGCDWSDGTYQLVQVTPSLSSTMFTDNLPTTHVEREPSWTSPSLASAIVCPPPITGGPSPWAATCQLVAGSPNNNIVFHPFANLAE
jgi:hypothetical protein